MGRLLGSWREYDIGRSGYEILAFVSDKDVDIAPPRMWVAPVDGRNTPTFTQGLSKDWCENMLGGCRA